MATYEINLIRDRVPTAGRRKRVYWFMMVYCLACGAVLVAVANRESKAFLKTAKASKESRDIEARFRERHPNQEGVVPYAEALRNRMEQVSGELEGIQTVLEKRANVARILLALLAPLPRDMMIIDFQFNLKSNKLSFNLMVPKERPEDSRDFGELLAEWNNSERLQMEVRQIQTVSRKRNVMGKKSVFIMGVVGDLADPST
jgi:hypothetical protein